ncbi:conjugal transfer protein TraG [Ilyomonas limi]|uniref:Conjugal transfer protein TraG n=2 Tax=Ilyomonas limi TaxID=2575867 RepID=A0A4U3KVP4_9BACT|nr:conjugal transfer protein TraG [Ilyomonas limi]
MNTGENEQGLRKVIDLTRMISIVLVLLHCYFYCYAAFKQWHCTAPIGDRILGNLAHTGLFTSFYKSKWIAAAFLLLSLVGVKGRKSEKMSYKKAFAYFILGWIIYFTSALCFSIFSSATTQSITYITCTVIGYILILTGGGLLTRIIKVKLSTDVFNKLNETFPQEERLLENEYSINLPAKYNLKGKERKSWINFINPMRGLLVLGSPGSGKSYFIIQHIIRQHIEKGFSLFIYDFKYDDLTRIAYNHLLKHKNGYTIEPRFYIINFDDLNRCHRCNPLHPEDMKDITDAVESARTILLGLNRSWIRKQGEFFIESPINFVTAVIWYLRKYKAGEYCTLPHVIELMQIDHEKLFTILRTEPEIEAYINPFISAYLSNSMEQLEGQIDAAKIGMARLASPILYYVMTGNDFTLDINNPAAPKIVCLANNPQKQEVYGAVLSLYISRMTKLVNQRDKLKSSLIFDEFPTIFFKGIDNLIATARSNKVATTIAVQDYSQLKNEYSREQAEVVMNIMGNVISGQVSGDTAKFLSEKFGRILQDKESISINASDTSVSRSKQLEQAVPPSVISGLSSGEFVGIVADNPDTVIDLKAFHCKVVNDHKALEKEGANFQPIPAFKHVDNAVVQRNYQQIKQDVQDILESEMEAILNDPAKVNLVVVKN